MNVDSSFQSDKVHFAWTPSLPVISSHSHPPVQLFTTASVGKDARKITAVKSNNDECAI